MDLHSEEFLREMMRRQFALSAGIAAVFIAIIVAIPLLNLFAAPLMNTPVMGFTLTWVILGFGIFPVLIGLAWLFVVRSNAFEDEAVGMVDPSTLPSANKTESASTTPAAPAAAK
jgi:uncharacterized membrane protein (DUF485 family)